MLVIMLGLRLSEAYSFLGWGLVDAGVEGLELGWAEMGTGGVLMAL